MMKLNELISDWIEQNDIAKADLKDIEACNFGIFEAIDGYTIYLTGSKIYDSEDDDWAIKIDFEPINKYLTILKKLTNELDWAGVFELVKKSLNSFMESEIFVSSHLNKVNIITTGFDSGGLIRIK